MNRPDLPMAKLRKMIRDLRADVNMKLDMIEARLHRRTPARRAKITSARMTPALRQAVRDMAAENPEMAMHDIAAALNVNVGRVSEVLSAEAAPIAEPQQPDLPVER